MNPRVRFLLGLISVLFIGALILRHGAILLICTLLLGYMLIGWFQVPADVRVSAIRELNTAQTYAGIPIEVHLTIKNEGQFIANLLIEDQSPQGGKVEGNDRSIFALDKGQECNFSYRYNAPRGVYHWESIRITARDPLGLFERTIHLPVYSKVLVRPKAIKLGEFKLAPRFTVHAPGSILAKMGGSGIDFFGIREYRSGDSLRHLDWRQTAKHHERFYTKTYELEEIASVGILVDARDCFGTGNTSQALFESSLFSAAAIAEAMVKQGNKVGLLIFGQRVSSVYPGCGKKHLNKILSVLASASLGKPYPFAYYKNIPRRLFPTHSSLMIISPLFQRDLDTYAHFRSLGYSTILISPNPIKLNAAHLPNSEVNVMAARLATIERNIQLLSLRNLGVHVIDWDVRTPLSHQIINPRNFQHKRIIEAPR